jgi:parallel beta-helix repeat protein
MLRVLASASVSLSILACGGDQHTSMGPGPTPTGTPSGIAILPHSTTLGIGQTVQFGAMLTFPDGSMSQTPVTWIATGGKIDDSGRYLGGPVSGNYQVIAKTSNGLADTATVILGVVISPAQSIPSVVAADPAGTTFILQAGTHLQQSVIPKSGDRFIGEPGAILDGQGVTPFAFSGGISPYASNVTIRGLRITGYQPRFQHGAVDAGGNSPSDATTGWVIDSNEVAYNGEYGIRLGNSARITNNNVHHNKRLNIAGSGKHTVIASNEIAFGNYLGAFDADFEAGGTKFTHSDGLVLRGNYVHDNVGAGLHLDLNNINTIVEANRVDHNGSEGIVLEISYKATIFNNTVTNNGWFDPRNRYNFIWNAGIGIHASTDVEVYGNTVSGNYAGVVAIEQNRSKDPADFGPHVVQNLYVHDNIITQETLPRTAGELSVGAGIATDIPGNTAIFTSRNNRYVGNTYNLGQNLHPFAWEFGVRTEAEWKSYGQDVVGIFNH